MGAGGQRDQSMIRRLEPLAPSSDFQGEERGWRLSSVVNSQWFKQPGLHNGTSIKNPKWWGSRASTLVNTWRCWEGGARTECGSSVQTITAPPYLALCISSIWLFLSSPLYNKPVNVSKELSWILWAILANYRIWRGVVGTLDFIAGWSQVHVA